MGPPTAGGGNGWDEWGRHVRAEIERLSEAIESLTKHLELMEKAQAERCARVHGDVDRRMEKLAIQGAIQGTKIWAICSLTAFLAAGFFAIAERLMG